MRHAAVRDEAEAEARELRDLGLAVDPLDPDGLRALESLFQLDLNLPQEVKDPHIGGRVYVRFEHGSMPLALQWYRSLRQLFLRKFYV